MSTERIEAVGVRSQSLWFKIFLLSLVAGFAYAWINDASAAILTGMGAVLLVTGFLLSPLGRQGVPSLPALLTVMLIATGLRVYDLENHSPGISGHGVAQFSIRDQFLKEPLLNFHLQWPLLSEPAQAMFFAEETAPGGLIEALWLRLVGVSVHNARLFTALVGVASVALAFLLGQALAGPRLGFCLGLMLAIEPWHIHVSRYDNTEHVLAPFHCLLCLLLCLRAMQLGRWRDYVALGAVLGLSIYVYATNQIMPGVVGVALTADFLFSPGQRKRKSLGLLCTIVFCTLVSSPQLLHNFHEGRYLPIRKNAYDNELYHVSGAAGLHQRSIQAFQQLFLQSDDPWLDKPNGGLMLLSKIFAPLGIGLLLVGLRRRREVGTAVLMGTTLVCSVVPAIFGPSAPFRRLILTATIADLGAGAGMAAFAAILLGRGYLTRMLTWVVVGGLTCWSAVYYFTEVSSFDSSSNMPQRKIAQYLKKHPDPWAVPAAVFAASDSDAHFIGETLRFESYTRNPFANPAGMSSYRWVIGDDALKRFVKEAGKSWTLIVMPRDLSVVETALSDVPHRQGFESYRRYSAYQAPPEGDVAILSPSGSGPAS